MSRFHSRSVIGLSVAALIALSALSVSATTYYVAPTGVEGAQDAADYGTSVDRPFATLNYAYQNAQQGSAAGYNEIVLLAGTHQIETRIAKGMNRRYDIHGATGNPADVTLDFQNKSEACLLVADLTLRDVTVINTACKNDGTRDGALRVQSSTYVNDATTPLSVVSNCVFRQATTTPVVLTGPARILDCRFENNEMSWVSGSYVALVFVKSGGNVGPREIANCVFTNNVVKLANGTCVVAEHSSTRLVDCTFRDNVCENGCAADVYARAATEIVGMTSVGAHSASEGASMCALTGVSVSIQDALIQGAVADGKFGGAIFLDGAASLIGSNVTVRACRSIGGSALAVKSSSMANFTFVDSVFEDNVTELSSTGSNGTGGAFYLHTATGRLERCELRNNTSARAAGAARLSTSSVLTLVDSTITGNTAGTQGGAFFCDVASGAEPTYGALTLLNCVLSENKATCSQTTQGDRGIHGGGAIALGAATTGESAWAPLFVDRCVFRGNISTYSGGAIYLRNAAGATAAGCRVEIRNTLFDGNQAGHFGGAINLVAHHAFVDNCTFVNNTAESSGPDFYHRWTSMFRNSLFVNDGSDKGGTFCGQTTAKNLYQNSIQVGRTDTNMKACFSATYDNQNMTADEIGKVAFVDATAGNYAIAAGSCARNNGQNLDWMSDDATCLDLAGAVRVSPSIAADGKVDIGCYEYVAKSGFTFIIR